MFFDEIFSEETEEEEPEEEPDPKPSLWERNRQALKQFINWRKKKQAKPLQLSFNF